MGNLLNIAIQHLGLNSMYTDSFLMAVNSYGVYKTYRRRARRVLHKLFVGVQIVLVLVALYVGFHHKF